MAPAIFGISTSKEQNEIVTVGYPWAQSLALLFAVPFFPAATIKYRADVSFGIDRNLHANCIERYRNAVM